MTHVLQPDVTTMIGEQETVKASLREVLSHVRDDIDNDLFKSVEDSMPNRV